MNDWITIDKCPISTYKICSPTLILAHKDRKWIRFGRWFAQEKIWYYSGTNERSQYCQMRGDAPTHWMPLPNLPT